MKVYEKVIHSFLLSMVFTLVNWTIVSNFIIPDLPFFKYLLIEILLVVSLKLFIFTKLKLGLN
jgi:hypothetical protein